MTVDKKPWVTVKLFTKGAAVVEVSRAGDTDRYSFRVSWLPEPGRQGPWFPANGMPFADDVAAAFRQAEAWVVERKAEVIKEHEQRIAVKRARLDAIGDRARGR